MHIPDGFIDGTTSAGAGAVAAGGLGASLRRAGEVLDERRVPLAGLVAAFVFAVQMLNFPVASGTSGHLLGGALAAVLVGPARGGGVRLGRAGGAGPAVRRRGSVGPRPQRAQHGPA